MSINVGIVGCGGIASHHIRGYRQPDAKIVMVADLDQTAVQVPIGSNRLLFLPYLLEGVAYNLRHILDILRSQGVEVEVMRLLVGGGKSPLWRQILADV